MELERIRKHLGQLRLNCFAVAAVGKELGETVLCYLLEMRFPLSPQVIRKIRKD